MPNIQYVRTWCKNCNDWQLFGHVISETDITCKKCGSVHQKVLLSEVPDDKIIEQRQRYKRYMSKSLSHSLLQIFAGQDFFSDIIESDVGQKIVDRQMQEKRDKKRRDDKELQTKFQGIGRNDKCRCDSGKKYKHCCYSKVQETYYT